MNKASKIISTVFFIAVGAILFVILYKAPFRLDDLTWGGRIGMERLRTFFRTQNGRYLGNLAVIALTRIPAVIRIIIEMAVMFVFFMCAHSHYGKQKVPSAVFIVLFAAMPVSIMSSTVTWVAGFANYFFSALFTLAVVAVDIKVLWGDIGLKGRKGMTCLIMLMVFAGQFFLETATIYIVLLSVAMAVIYAVREHKTPKFFIIQTAVSLAGALILFANPSYRSAVTHDGLTYKSIDFGNGGLGGVIATLWKNYNDEVVFRWFGMNSILNIVLTLIVIIVCIRSRKVTGYVFACAGALFEGAFVYDFFDGESELLINADVMAVLSIAYYLFVFAAAVIFVKDGRSKFRMVIYFISSLIFMGPFTIVSPVTDRCLMMTYIFWCLIAAEFVMSMGLSFGPREDGAAFICASVLVCGIMGWFLTTQFDMWKFQDLRMEEVQKCIDKHYRVFYLPKVPDAKKYCYGLNIPQDDYWLTNYKDYYGIDRSCRLEFVNYNEWMVKRALNR